MESIWQETEFQELLVDKSISYGVVQPGSHTEQNCVPIVRVNNIRNGVIETLDVMKISAEIESKYKRTRLEGGELLITVVGSVGECAIVPESLKGWNVARAVSVARILPLADVRFVKYAFKSEDIIFQMYGGTNDTVQPTLNLSSLKTLKLKMPPLPEQRAIAGVLSSLDDKIDLLHRQNKTLEAMAETLFRQWFVEEANDDWEKRRIADCGGAIQYGFTQSATKENIGPKFLRITDIQGGKVTWREVPHCIATESETEKYRLRTGDIVIARTGASTGENLYIHKPEEAVFASYLIRIQFESRAFSRYVAMHTRSDDYFDYIEGILSGSAQPNANAKELTSFEIRIPPNERLDEFHARVTDLDEKRYCNEKQIAHLEKFSDLLLPKLMSGDVRVL